jgi:glutamate carboxypeptidase
MKDLLTHLDGKESEMISLLEALVNMDCGSHDKAGVDRVGEVLARRLAALDFSVERVPQTAHGDHIVGRKAGSGHKRILFLGHMDTVFPAGTAQKRPFRIEGGRAYGPGVLDMKGGIVCLLFALEGLKETDHPFFSETNLDVVFNSDEEILSPTSRPIIEERAKQAQTVCVFEPARPGGEYVIRRKGVAKYGLTVRGRAAHAGAQPEAGRSAIGELAHKILALHGLTDLEVGTTVNVGVIRGGERFNVVAEQAQAEIDVRVPDLQEAERVEACLRKIAERQSVPDTSSELTGGLIFPPMTQSAAGRTLFEALQDAGRAVGLAVRGIATGGGSDGNHAAQYAPTLDGMGPQGSEAHSDREFIELPTLVQRAKVTALFLASWPEVMARMEEGPRGG